MATVLEYSLRATGGDYSLIKSWLADMLTQHPDLVSEDIILQLNIYNDWPAGLDETFVDFNSGFTTDATHYFNLSVVDGERHNGTPGTGFHFACSATNLCFYPRSQHVVFDGLEVSAPSASEVMFGASSNTTVKNCILHSISSRGFSSSTGAIYENCVLYDTAPSSSSNIGVSVQGAELRNVTAYIEQGSGGFNGDIVFHSCSCTNVYLYHDHTKISLDAFFGCTGDYNAALAINGAIPNGNSVFITDDSDLEDPANDDYRLKSSSTLRTLGEGGDVIGARFEKQSVGGTSSTVAFDVLKPEFSASATVTLPQPNSSAGIEITKPVFNVNSSATLPQPASGVDFAIDEPLFSVSTSVTLPSGVADVAFDVEAPLFSASVIASLPQPLAIVSVDVLAPLFSVSAEVSETAISSDVDLTIIKPEFSAQASITLPSPNSDVLFNIDKPMFSARVTVSGIEIIAADNAKITLNYKSNIITPQTKSNYIKVN